MTGRVTREDLVEESVQMFLKDQILTVRGYPSARVEFVDAFVETRFDALRSLDKNYVAAGFNFDDGGEAIELGSNLLRRTYTIEVWVIATDVQSGRNLANAIRDSAEADNGLIPLRDVTQPGAPVVDYLIVDAARAQRQPIPDPKPWQEALYVVQIPVTDEYFGA